MGKTIVIWVEGGGDEPFDCPFQASRGCCGAIEGSDINHCPKLVDTDDGRPVWYAPDDCPVADSGVIVVGAPKQLAKEQTK